MNFQAICVLPVGLTREGWMVWKLTLEWASTMTKEGVIGVFLKLNNLSSAVWLVNSLKAVH